MTQMSFYDADIPAQPPAPPSPPAAPPTAPNPKRPRYTARGAAERVEMRVAGHSPTTRHDTIRRRVQDLEENLDLLIIYSDSGPRTVYEITRAGALAAYALAQGKQPKIPWNPVALARVRDRQPSHSGVTKLRPDKDFHNILRVFGGYW